MHKEHPELLLAYSDLPWFCREPELPESFEGYVECVRNGIGYFSFTMDGQEYTGERDWIEMQAGGCRERRRFICRFQTRVEFEGIPDRVITAEEIAEFNARIDALFADLPEEPAYQEPPEV